MSKAVLISIRPKYCELIASGKKTIEVRKTKPKIETPFRCYMYMSAYHWAFSLLREYGMEDLADRLMHETGKVIGEFVCDQVYKFSTRVYLGEEQKISDEEIVAKSCLSRPELRSYEGNKQGFYGWHISNLKIYDQPKELDSFVRTCTWYGKDIDKCWDCFMAVGEEHDCGVNGLMRLERAPQSWCYVREVNSR